MIKKVFLGFSIVLISISCDVIDGNVVTAPIEPGDTTQSSFSKSILLVEFTGHKCGNCPVGGETAELLKGTYGSRLVVIAAHVGTLAQPQPPASGKYILDFRTGVGDALDDEFGASVSGIPQGVINYIEFNTGTALLKPDAWPGKVDELLQEQTVPYGLTPQLSIEGDFIKLTATVEFGEAVTGNFNLGAFLTEDSIIAWQKDYRLTGSQDIEYFNHKHVLRSNFYPSGANQVLPWGLPLSGTSFVQGDSESLDLDTKLKADYNQDHLNVIVFLYDRDTKTILQVKEFHLADEI